MSQPNDLYPDDLYPNDLYILLIMTCKRYAHKAEKQKATWLQNINMNNHKLIYYHVLGDPQLQADEEFFFNDETRLLVVKTPDDYINLPKKVIAAYAAVRTKFANNYTFIFKTDDDQMLMQPFFFPNLQHVLQKKSFAYGGFPVTIPKHRSSYHLIHPELPPNLLLQATTYCSGRFYFLSRAAVDYLTMPNQRALVEKEYFEDYAIGYHLSAFVKEIYPINSNKIFKDF